jgi:hypothetical protein
MTDEAQDASKSRSRVIGWGCLWWVGLALVLYVLSSGPVLMVVHKRIIRLNSPTYRFLASFYQPLNWVANVTPLDKPLQMYWELWTSHVSDTKKNRK